MFLKMNYKKAELYPSSYYNYFYSLFSDAISALKNDKIAVTTL